MKYRYTSFYPPDKSLKWVKKPIISIEVFGPGGSQTFGALIDSGADCSLFNIQIAQALGFGLSVARRIRMTGISGDVEGYRLENVEIKVEGIDKTVKIPISFADSLSIGTLLGQEGFFDKHRIKFEKDHDTFEKIPVQK
jgi:hypothetical protein